jgi:hypothetical protein
MEFTGHVLSATATGPNTTGLSYMTLALTHAYEREYIRKSGLALWSLPFFKDLGHLSQAN